MQYAGRRLPQSVSFRQVTEKNTFQHNKNRWLGLLLAAEGNTSFSLKVSQYRSPRGSWTSVRCGNLANTFICRDLNFCSGKNRWWFGKRLDYKTQRGLKCHGTHDGCIATTCCLATSPCECTETGNWLLSLCAYVPGTPLLLHHQPQPLGYRKVCCVPSSTSGLLVVVVIYDVLKKLNSFAAGDFVAFHVPCQECFWQSYSTSCVNTKLHCRARESLLRSATSCVNTKPYCRARESLSRSMSHARTILGSSNLHHVSIPNPKAEQGEVCCVPCPMLGPRLADVIYIVCQYQTPKQSKGKFVAFHVPC